jgi:DivIVA domain-containing protein
MPLTPAQVRGVVFSTPAIGERGYHENEVDAFLEAVAAELARLLAENTDLSTQLAQCDQQPLPGPLDTTVAPLQPASPPMRHPPSAGEDDYQDHAARVLNLAQQSADRVTSQAQADAAALIHQAHANAEQLLEAHWAGEGMISEATTRTETILHDARVRADTVDQQSRDKLTKVASQQQEQLRQHTALITALGADKAPLEHSIVHLRMFEDDYRSRMMRFLHIQLQRLGAHELARPADSLSAQRTPAVAGSGARPETFPPWPAPDKHRWRPAVGA